MKFNPVRNLISRALLKKGETINILVSPTHSPYECNLCEAMPEVNFYAYRQNGSHIIPHWNPVREKPAQYHMLDENGGDISIPDVEFHAALVQNVDAQHQYLFRYAQLMQIPYIGLFHTMAPYSAPPQYIAQVRQIPFSAVVFITEYSKYNWGFSDDPRAQVIYHTMNLDEFKPLGYDRQLYIMSMGNDATTRGELGFNITMQIAQGLPHKHFGTDKNSRLHNPLNGSKAINEELNKCGIYINTCVWSPLPMSLLEACAAGCPIVTTNSCAVPDVFTHKENCYMFPADKPEIGRKHVEYLLEHPEECKRIGNNARKLAEEFFSPERFASQWNELIWKIIKQV